MKSNSSNRQDAIRPPAVAGTFYSNVPGRLHQDVTGYLEAAKVSVKAVPKAVIAPHAGYVYSGPIAGSAFAPLMHQSAVRRVIVLGPSHRVAFQGLALPRAVGFATPLGVVPVDAEVVTTLATLPQVKIFDAAHANEHALEVELPFLQTILGEFKFVPLVVGDASDAEVGEVVELLWGGPETLFVISSDLSHYLDYATAKELDAQTARAIERLCPEDIGGQQACGRIPIRGLLWAARQRRMSATTLDLRSSGDTAGSRDQVVGYGAFAFVEN